MTSVTKRCVIKGMKGGKKGTEALINFFSFFFYRLS